MSKQYKKNKLLHIATIGKTVGIHGDMKLHIKCDFPEQFHKNATFLINQKDRITLSDVNLERMLVKINSITNPEDAKKFTNLKLYATQEETRLNCQLEDGENFWFDIEGCQVLEDGMVLGVVDEVERLTMHDFLNVKTDEALVKEGYAKRFLIPYIPPFKRTIDIEKKIIEVDGAFAILKAS